MERLCLFLLLHCMQGVKGLLEREEVAAAVQRVEVPGGNWRPGDSILVYTSRGVLALEPPSPAAFSLWALGLNAALVAAQVLLLPCSTMGAVLPFLSLFVALGEKHAWKVSVFALACRAGGGSAPWPAQRTSSPGTRCLSSRSPAPPTRRNGCRRRCDDACCAMI